MPGSNDVRTFENYGDLPEAIQDFIFNTNDEDTSRIVDAAGLAGPTLKAFFEETKKAYLKKLPLSEFAAALKSRLPDLPDDKLRTLVRDYIGYRFLPLDDFYDGEPSSVLRGLGADPSAYPRERIIMRAASPTELVTEFLHEHPTNVPAHLEHRLREILESRVRNVRKDDETVTRLTRAEKIGGVELEREAAEKLVEALAAKVASVKIAPDNVPTPIVIAPTAIPVEAKSFEAKPLPASQAEVSPQNAKSGHGFTPADEHEANVIRETVLPKVVSSAVFDTDEEIKKGADAVFDATDVPLSVPLEERYMSVVTSRLKGVRDAAETRDLLMREAAKGGMGFAALDANKAMLLIEKQVQAVNGKREETIKSEKTAFIKSSVDATLAKDEARKKGELEALDRMYGSLTGKVSKKPVSEEPRTPPKADQHRADKNQFPTTPPPITDDGRRMTDGGQAKTSSAPAPPAPPIPVRVPPPVAAPALIMPPPLPPVAPPPVAPAPSPRMQDVRRAPPPAAARQLTGPVQELANLTLTDFRRLGADPNEACRKLSDKLDILEEHSYGARIAGIQAWQGSEVYKRYLQTINAAFSGGKPIAAAIADNFAAGRETLTEREVRAIMELNKQLKA